MRILRTLDMMPGPVLRGRREPPGFPAPDWFRNLVRRSQRPVQLVHRRGGRVVRACDDVRELVNACDRPEPRSELDTLRSKVVLDRRE